MTKRVYPEGMVYASPEYWRWYREQNKEKLRSYSREYSQKRYLTTPETERARRARYRVRNPIKIRAHELLNAALQMGKVTKTPCKECGLETVFAHHDNYGTPLEVIWLCSVHHSARHKYLRTINHDSENMTIAALEELFRPRKRTGRPRKI